MRNGKSGSNFMYLSQFDKAFVQFPMFLSHFYSIFLPKKFNQSNLIAQQNSLLKSVQPQRLFLDDFCTSICCRISLHGGLSTHQPSGEALPAITLGEGNMMTQLIVRVTASQGSILIVTGQQINFRQQNIMYYTVHAVKCIIITYIVFLGKGLCDVIL